jgi:hypothetical protein
MKTWVDGMMGVYEKRYTTLRIIGRGNLLASQPPTVADSAVRDPEKGKEWAGYWYDVASLLSPFEVAPCDCSHLPSVPAASPLTRFILCFPEPQCHILGGSERTSSFTMAISCTYNVARTAHNVDCRQP